MRVESERPVGEGKGWIHRLSEPLPAIAPRQKVEQPHDANYWTALAERFYDREDAAEVRASTAADLGVSVESLERLGVGSGRDEYRSLHFSTWPERRQGGKVMGIVRRYRVPVTDEGGNKLAMRGGHQGLYLPRDWWRGEGPLLIPEGGSDTAALISIGLSAIGRPSNVAGVNQLIGVLKDSEQLNRPIIVLGERDKKADRVGTKSCRGGACDGCPVCYPGRYGARVTTERLKEALPRKTRILWRMPPTGAKDVRAWVSTTDAPTPARLLNRLEVQ